MGNVILGLLLVGPATLYALTKQFEQGISLFYSASLGSLRAAVTVLLERGLVTVAGSVENGRNKKTYSITDAGRAAFAEWMTAPITGGDLETIALSKVYFLGMLTDTASRATVLAGILDRIRADQRQLESLAGHLDAVDIPPEYAEIFRYQRITLDYGLLSHRTARKFFESLAQKHELPPP
ncbi:MAG: PadR family transcriptional regulator [Microbacteriaceae bacterium]|nr:PadR family transcriptional regulator [Microbacteriaceae bacterium]